MKRRQKLLFIVLLLLVLVAATSIAEEKEKDPFLANLLSTTVGFGTGHFYLHDHAAVKFLVLDSVTSAVTIGAVVYTAVTAIKVMKTNEISTGVWVGVGLCIAGGLASTGIRIWEMIDISSVIKEQRAAGKLTMKPVIELGPGASHVGVALSY
jgi:hypothetical protein